MKDLYNQFLEAYDALDPQSKSSLRFIARAELRAEGSPEIGSSDVSCRVYEFFRYLGNFHTETLRTFFQNHYGDEYVDLFLA